jgi:hypothetical protein
MTVYVFCDESGKFKDHAVVSFGAVAAGLKRLDDFETAWKYCLREAGLSYLTMKEALNCQRPLSEKNPAQGEGNRVAAILPFVDCLKRNLGLLTGFAIDVHAFHSISSAAQKHLGKNPQYAAFARVVQETMKEEVSEGGELCIICDDEEEVALGVYKLYRKLKLYYPVARKRIVSLSLADDEVFYPLQGADLVASLLRLEARRIFLGEDYYCRALYERLITKLEIAPQATVTIGLFNRDKLAGLSKSFIEFEQQYGKYGVASLVEEKHNPSGRPVQ